MSSGPASGETESPDDFIQRAQLLAELGRYDEAAAELGFALALEPANHHALVVLARVHLAADRPAEALAAAEAAVAVAPDAAFPLVVRALALVDLRRFDEAARVADELLARWSADSYAQRSAAAILGEARNGQRALDAAWRAVQVAPHEAEAHLVLGLIAARLELFDLAERAYREALRLDPALAEADEDVGIIRLERRRYSRALAQVAALAAVEPVHEPSPRTVGDHVRRVVLWGSGYAITAAVLTAGLAAGNAALSRMFAVVAGIGGVLLVWRFAAAAPALLRVVLPGLVRSDPILAWSVGGALAAPLLILLYALLGSPWPLVAALALTAVGPLAVGRRRPLPSRPPTEG